MMRGSISRALAPLALVLAMALAPPGSARSADWPAKPVRIIVPYAAGGAADTAGRLYPERPSPAVRQQVLLRKPPRGGGGAGGPGGGRGPARGGHPPFLLPP